VEGNLDASPPADMNCCVNLPRKGRARIGAKASLEEQLRELERDSRMWSIDCFSPAAAEPNDE